MTRRIQSRQNGWNLSGEYNSNSPSQEKKKPANKWYLKKIIAEQRQTAQKETCGGIAYCEICQKNFRANYCNIVFYGMKNRSVCKDCIKKYNLQSRIIPDMK